MSRISIDKSVYDMALSKLKEREGTLASTMLSFSKSFTTASAFQEYKTMLAEIEGCIKLYKELVDGSAGTLEKIKQNITAADEG